MEITLEALTKVYEGTQAPALKGVSTRIESGEFFFLLGPSGCGKTTLLRLIAGLLTPSSGRILFGDRDVTALSVDQRGAAMVFQGYALWPHMTVRDNVEFGPRMQGVPAAERQRLGEEQLARVRMAEYAERKPNQLSGGQQQRVALARALAARTRCLLLDEPLSNLDARLRLYMREELRGLVKSAGMTAIYVTHDQKEALSMADRIAVMNAGEVVQLGAPEELYNRPRTRFVADFLGEANFLDAVAGREPAAPLTTAFGPLRCLDLNAVAPGATLTCCVRPEHIDIDLPESRGDPADNRLAAKVVSSMYLGEMRQYLCELEGAPAAPWRVSALASRSPVLAPGARVALRFSPGHTVPLQD